MYRYGNTVRWIEGTSPRLDAQIALAIRDTTAPYPDLRTWWDVYRWWLAQGKEN